MNGADLMRSAQKSPKTVQDYAAATAEEMAYRQSEEYQRKQWEADQKRWLDKARREGWTYTPRPFVGALERQQQAEEARKREIAELEERLAALKG